MNSPGPSVALNVLHPRQTTTPASSVTSVAHGSATYVVRQAARQGHGQTTPRQRGSNQVSFMWHRDGCLHMQEGVTPQEEHTCRGCGTWWGCRRVLRVFFFFGGLAHELDQKPGSQGVISSTWADVLVVSRSAPATWTDSPPDPTGDCRSPACARAMDVKVFPGWSEDVKGFPWLITIARARG